MSPDAPALVREMADVLRQQEHLSGPDLAATLEPRLAVRHHGGAAYVRSFLLADCAALDCLLAGPPDPDPDETGAGGMPT